VSSRAKAAAMADVFNLRLLKRRVDRLTVVEGFIKKQDKWVRLRLLWTPI